MRDRSGLSAPALLVLFLTTAPATQARKDQILILGNPAGAQTVAERAGATRAEYSFNDRGRGDHIIATWKLDDAGVPIDYRGSGNDYVKAAVTESFHLVDGKASWRSRAEQGDRTVSGEAFYVPANAPPEMLGVLARALLKAPGHRLALLPAGEARLEAVGPPPGDAGSGKHALIQYEISGLDLSPTRISEHADRRHQQGDAGDEGRPHLRPGAHRAGARHRAAESHLRIHRRFMREAL